MMVVCWTKAAVTRAKNRSASLPFVRARRATPITRTGQKRRQETFLDSMTDPAAAAETQPKLTPNRGELKLAGVLLGTGPFFVNWRIRFRAMDKRRSAARAKNRPAPGIENGADRGLVCFPAV
jgi:hypothetical protein